MDEKRKMKIVNKSAVICLEFTGVAFSFQLPCKTMKLRSLLLGLLAIGALLLTRISSLAETNDAAAIVTLTNVVNIAEVDQLIAKVESLQRDNDVAAERFTALTAQNNSLSNVLSGLQQSLDAQRKREIEITEEAHAFNGRVMAGAGVAIFLVFLASYWFQLRCLNRVMDVTRASAPELPAPFGPALLEAVQARESRLLDSVKLLEDRIRQLEMPHVATTRLNENVQARPADKVIEVAPAPAVPSQISPTAPIETKISVLLAKGEVLLEAERFQDAANTFQEALSYEPTNVEAQLKKGNALERIGKLEPALACYNEAARLNPKRSFAYVHKARVLAALHRYDEALSVYDLALGNPVKANGAHEPVRMFKDASV